MSETTTFLSGTYDITDLSDYIIDKCTIDNRKEY